MEAYLHDTFWWIKCTMAVVTIVSCISVSFQISVVVYYGHQEDTDHNEQWIKLYQPYKMLKIPFQN